MRAQRIRVSYRPDQCLAAADIAAQSEAETELLALHQARVHDSWGILHGFGCTLGDDGGVSVAPGLGLDARGRLILLSRERRLPPPGAGGAVLVASYAERLTADGCSAGGLPAEEPVLRWRHAEAVRVGIELPLGRLRPDEGDGSLDRGVRKVAHALVRPKVAAGRVLRSSLAVEGTYGNWTMWVPTTAGGLSSPAPAYFVSLDQHPWGELADFGSTEPPPVQQRLAEWVGPFVAVEAVAASGFRLRVSGRLGTWRQGDYPRPGTNPVGLSWVGIDTTFTDFLFPQLLDLRNWSFFFGGVP